MKLYRCRLVYEWVALADDEEGALNHGDEVVREGDPTDEHATVCGKAFLPPGWNEGSLVYHDGDEDITVAEARKRVDRG